MWVCTLVYVLTLKISCVFVLPAIQHIGLGGHTVYRTVYPTSGCILQAVVQADGTLVRVVVPAVAPADYLIYMYMYVYMYILKILWAGQSGRCAWVPRLPPTLCSHCSGKQDPLPPCVQASRVPLSPTLCPGKQAQIDSAVSRRADRPPRDYPTGAGKRSPLQETGG